MQQVHIAKWGNSLGFRIPRGIADSLNIRAGDTLDLTPADGGLLIKKVTPTAKSYALADVLTSFAPASAQAAVDFGAPQGEEIW